MFGWKVNPEDFCQGLELIGIGQLIDITLPCFECSVTHLVGKLKNRRIQLLDLGNIVAALLVHHWDSLNRAIEEGEGNIPICCLEGIFPRCLVRDDRITEELKITVGDR